MPAFLLKLNCLKTPRIFVLMGSDTGLTQINIENYGKNRLADVATICISSFGYLPVPLHSG